MFREESSGDEQGIWQGTLRRSKAGTRQAPSLTSGETCCFTIQRSFVGCAERISSLAATPCSSNIHPGARRATGFVTSQISHAVIALISRGASSPMKSAYPGNCFCRYQRFPSGWRIAARTRKKIAMARLLFLSTSTPSHLDSHSLQHKTTSILSAQNISSPHHQQTHHPTRGVPPLSISSLPSVDPSSDHRVNSLESFQTPHHTPPRRALSSPIIKPHKICRQLYI